MNITDEQKRFILNLARKSIENIFTKTELPEIPKDEKLYNSKSGVFVTLAKNGELRGCIGFITADTPLNETIVESAELAATRDPRFHAVEKNELNNISIEVSILSEPFDLNSYDEIEIGKHGLILREGMYRGVLLPQVPIEHNMNRDQFLSAICNKAGLPRDTWKQRDIKLKAFTATVFSEEEIGENDE